jgi:hypothetical protein
VTGYARAATADELDGRELAMRLEAENPQWIVLFGAYSGEFVCFPRFDAPSGTIVAARYPPAAADRMRGIEESCRKSRERKVNDDELSPVPIRLDG